jgi:hypothetical protein
MRAHTSGRVTSFVTMREMQCVPSSRKTYPCQNKRVMWMSCVSVRLSALNNAPFLSSSTCGCYQIRRAKLGNLPKCSAVLQIGEHCTENYFYFLILSFYYLRCVNVIFTITRSQTNALTKWCHTFHSSVNYCRVRQCAGIVVACYHGMSDCIRHPHVRTCP